MGKYNLIIYIAVAALLLFLVSRSSHKSKPQGQGHGHRRRLIIRSHFSFAPPPDLHHHHDRPPAFDPIVSEIELRREDKEWEHLYFQMHHNASTDHDHDHDHGHDHGHGHDHDHDHDHHAPGHESQPEWEDFADAEDYLNDEHRFNVTKRLMLLFPRIDVDPPDGFVSESELTQWNLQQSRNEALHRSQREMDTHDKTKDGLVSFAEYEAPSWVRDADKTAFGYAVGWWKVDHFNSSDADGDGFLNITEFNDFLHPADTSNPKLLLWLCKEEIRERDRDYDQMVSFQEFFHGIFELVRNHEEMQHTSDESGDSIVAPAKLLFSQLDKDGDGHLSAEELLPIIGKLHPPEIYYAKQQTAHIMHQADMDKDGHLSLEEMIDSPYVFYTAVFSEDDEGDADDYGLHDEFR